MYFNKIKKNSYTFELAQYVSTNKISLIKFHLRLCLKKKSTGEKPKSFKAH